MTTAHDQMPSSNAVPPGALLWGAATSAYQIEGAAHVGGRGASIWDAFAHQPGAVERGEHGDVACDHYRLWEADLALMSQLGLRAYRFSVAWPRIHPNGRGSINTTGLDFYDRLVDGLMARGITPCATLYHWDLPLALQEHGGWLWRDTARYFADYAHSVTQRLGDRVKFWMTLNEPSAHTELGYVMGVHAPGLRRGEHYFAAMHHQLLAHGLALEPLRANVRDAQVGIAYNLAQIEPATDRSEDQEAAIRADVFAHGAYLEATLRGHYPADVAVVMPADIVEPGDLDIISRPVDVIGVNYYLRLLARAAPLREIFGYTTELVKTRRPTAMGWEEYPAGLAYWLNRLQSEYPDQTIVVTENGIGLPDRLGPAGVIADTRRIDYLREHIGVTLAALRAGVKIGGYFVWSLLDNFEWQCGYRPRFGLVGVDHHTQQRTIKASGYWYAQLIASGNLE